MRVEAGSDVCEDLAHHLAFCLARRCGDDEEKQFVRGLGSGGRVAKDPKRGVVGCRSDVGGGRAGGNSGPEHVAMSLPKVGRCSMVVKKIVHGSLRCDGRNRFLE